MLHRDSGLVDYQLRHFFGYLSGTTVQTYMQYFVGCPSIPRPSATSTGPFARSPVDNHKRPFVIGEFNCSCLGLAGFMIVRGKDIKDENRDFGVNMANLIRGSQR